MGRDEHSNLKEEVKDILKIKGLIEGISNTSINTLFILAYFISIFKMIFIFTSDTICFI